MLDQEFIKNMPKLGFGLMRLPRIDEKTIDVEQAKIMTDLFLEAGMKYFDTAYVYEGSEEATRKALVERHPRDSYYLADKLNAGVWAAKNKEEALSEFKISLERTGAGYFDFYLLHAMNKDNMVRYEEFGIWDYVKQLKEEGLIRHFGFSFHDSPETLEKILTAHPEVEFVQLQLNYADWNSLTVQSRKCYEVCVKHEKPVVVMEPVKGGTLAVPPTPIQDLLKKEDPKASCASWAIRYVASLPNVMVVLSGMSNIEQMQDNLSYMKAFKPLSEKEQQVILEAQHILSTIEQIPCTACHYCTAGCPMNIAIPNIFSAMNWDLIYRKHERAVRQYQDAVKEHGLASDCIHCGCCEQACPQHIEIRSWLEKCADTLEK